MPQAPDRLAIGCMTGTSIDGLDVALVLARGHGLGMHAACLRGHSIELGELRGPLRDLAEQRPMTAQQIAELARAFALLHARAVRELLALAGVDAASIELVSVHGQTVYHAPPVSWQMFAPAVLSRELGVPVVSDLRAADLAAGGQGAPITPIADWIFFRSVRPAAVVNLGGFCNITVLPAPSGLSEDPLSPASVRGYDLCACNHLLDQLARELLRLPFDEDGRHAIAGQPHEEALASLTERLSRQSRSGRSLGTGDELAAWLGEFRTSCSSNDLCATACTAIGSLIAGSLAKASAHDARVYVAGGGARNAGLVRAIKNAHRGHVETTDGAGLPAAYREAAHMAILGLLCADGVPITLPAVTGVKSPAPIAGVWAGDIVGLRPARSSASTASSASSASTEARTPAASPHR